MDASNDVGAKRITEGGERAMEEVAVGVEKELEAANHAGVVRDDGSACVVTLPGEARERAVEIGGKGGALGFAGEAAPDGGRRKHVVQRSLPLPRPPADFACCVLRACDKFSADDDGDAEAAARAKDHVVGELASGTEPALGKRDDAKIVVKRDSDVVFVLQLPRERHILPVFDKGVVARNASNRINDAGNADSDAEKRSGSLFGKSGDEFADLRDDGSGRHGLGKADGAIVGLGAGKIDAHTLNTLGIEFDSSEPTGVRICGERALRAAHGAVFETVFIEMTAADQVFNILPGGGGGKAHQVGQLTPRGGALAANMQHGLGDEMALVLRIAHAVRLNRELLMIENGSCENQRSIDYCGFH